MTRLGVLWMVVAPWLTLFVTASKIPPRHRTNARDPLPRKLAHGRIIGGTNAAPGEFPYFVNWDGECGASLIHEDIILSAGHCSVVFSDTVYVGAYRFNSIANGAQQRTITVRRLHPNFADTFDSVSYDFLVMKLDRPVTSIRPIPLNRNSSIPFNNQVLTLIGFGDTIEYVPSQPPILQKVNVNYVSNAACANNYSEFIPSVEFCAGVPAGGKDTCQGDSGGPVITAQGIQVGITSYGRGCGRPGYPGVYARISGAISWINQQICQLSDNPPSSCPPTPPTRKPTRPPPTLTPVRPSLVPVRPTTTPPTTATQLVVVDLYYDRDSRETKWILLNKNGQIIGTSPYGLDGISDSWVAVSFVLTPGESYVLRIFDSYGDGFCCTYGIGYYSVRAIVNGKNVILAGGYGDFDSRLDVPFVVSSSAGPPGRKPTPRPVQKPVPTAPVRPTTAPATTTTLLVTLDLLHDDYISETSWLLLDKNRQVIGRSSAVKPIPGSWTTSVFRLSPGQRYIWQIIDYDGISGGSYTVRAVRNGNDIVLAQGDGDFDTGIDVSFVVPSA